ncbi:hypothetical protein CSA56_00075, partial [candidate division KSB3 bacterium]
VGPSSASSIFKRSGRRANNWLPLPSPKNIEVRKQNFRSQSFALTLLKFRHGLGTSVKKLQISGVCQTNNQMLYDEEVQFRAKEFLFYEALEPEDSPFFLQVSYTHPHDALQVTQTYWDLYSEDEAGFPTVPAPPHDAGTSSAYVW